MIDSAMVKKETAVLTIPAFGNTPEIKLDVTNIKEGENRFLEAKVVNGGTYADLEYSFNEGYRQAKKHLSTIMYQIAMSEKEIRRVKSECLLDEYPDFLKENKIKDSTATKEAYLERKIEYVNAMDRLAMLKAMECLFEGKVKVFENVCRFMRKEIDLQRSSGAIDSNKYMR
jgi:hypothetical protein